MSSLGSSSPKTSLDKSCINIRKAEDQSCNVTDDNLGSDCYESMHAFKKIRTSTSGLRKSPNKWTKEENQKLAALVSSYGEKKWKRISAEMGGQKTGAQCAQHWKRVLSPEIRKGHWDENEEDLLLRLVVQYGSCWKKIAKKIPQRTDIQCRYQYLKAKQSREVMWDPKEDESLMKKVMEMANCNFFQVLNDGATPAGTQPSTTPNSSNNGNDSPSSTSYMNSPSFTNSPLRGSSQYNTASPMLSPNASRSIRIPPISLNKENEDNALSSSYGSGSESKEDTDEEEYARMKMSGDFTKDAWNDDKHNVNMGGGSPDGATTTSWRSGSGGMGGKELNSPFSDRLCANCRSPFTSHLNKVVWLEISEHMARLKLTSTLRTALECKTRFTELLGNKTPYTPNSFGNLPESKPSGLKNSGDLRRGYNHPLGGSGGFSAGAPSFNAGPSAFSAGTSFSAGASSFNAAPSLNAGPSFSAGASSFSGGASEGKGSFHNGSLSDIKINTPLNKSPSSGNPNINLTNCNNNNITINITNSYTTNTNQSGSHFQQLTHNSPTAVPLKSEHNSTPLPGPSHLLSKAVTASILSPAPPFPSFSHMSLPSFPHLPQPQPHMSKPSPRNTIGGLESLAAVASILPREMLADYF